MADKNKKHIYSVGDRIIVKKIYKSSVKLKEQRAVVESVDKMGIHVVFYDGTLTILQEGLDDFELYTYSQGQ